MKTKLLVGGTAILVVLAGLCQASCSGPPAETAGGSANAAAPGRLTTQQIARLGIRVEPAAAVDGIPLGTVPAQVSLPPQARVAVMAPFAGVAMQVLVLEGQQVSRGQPLAVVRAAQPVQFGAELARAQADLGFEKARAERLSMLAREGVVAGARADEARAAVTRTQATIAENRRLLALAGAATDGTATLRAPIAGRVAHMAIAVGGPIDGSTAPFVIEDTAELALDLQLPERLAGRVTPGMTVAVVPTGADATGHGKAVGRILAVGGSLDPVSRALSARATLGAAPGLVPGQGVTVMITDMAGPNRRGMSIPASALTRIDGKTFVFVRQGRGQAARFVRRAVATVAEAGGRVVVSDGLAAGEPVAVSGVAELKSLLGGE